MSKKPYQVINTDIEQLEKEIRNHRMQILKKLLLLLAAAMILAGIAYYIYETKTYTEYQVVESEEREDSVGTRFVEFRGNILKYSNDGAFYINTYNQPIWNQSYEMQLPVLDICENYVAIYEKKGKVVYIMNTSGPCGEIQTNLPIQQVHVANQGMVAVLMEENGTGYIQLFDKEGTFLAEGELHTKNSGYPLDISISNDGKKLVVAMLDVSEGTARTNVAFYNFGSVGQNEIDNIVSSYPYSDMIIPKVEFLTNDIAVAFGENAVIIYEGSQKPVSKQEIKIEQEIRSIFYNEYYIGLVFENKDGESAYRAEIYDLKGKKTCDINFSMEYDEIEFLSNDEICIRNDLECALYTLRGTKRFHCNFRKNVYKIIHITGRRYLILTDGMTEKIVLK